MEVVRRGETLHQGWCIMEQNEEQVKERLDFPEEDEEDVYSSRAREKLVEEDTLNTDEDAFMLGYEKGLREIEEEEEELWEEENHPEEIA